MSRFTSFDGTEIDYDDVGEGPPVLLLHGFAADRVANWEQPKVIATLVDAGHRVVAPTPGATAAPASRTTRRPTPSWPWRATRRPCSTTWDRLASTSSATPWARSSRPARSDR